MRQAATTAECTIEGTRIAGVAFKPGTSGVPDALIDAAFRAEIPLDRSTQEMGPEESMLGCWGETGSGQGSSS